MQPKTTLYQFTLCPFCNKVRAGLDLKGVAYDVVEVSPRTKVELPDLPDEAPRKVPVLRVGDQVMYDSTDILKAFDETFPDGLRFLPEDPEQRAEAERIEEWVDTEFIRALPTVLYGTWGSAAKAARIIGAASNFSAFQGLGVKLGGPLIMHMVAGRILKKAGRSDGAKWVAECLDQFEEWLGDDDYVCGDTLTLADVAMHGAVNCVADFPIHAEIMKRTKVAAWFQRITDERARLRPAKN